MRASRPIGGKLPCALAAAALALAGGCGGTDDEGGGPPQTAAGTAQEAPSTTAPGAVKVWFTAGEQLRPVEREIPKSGSTLSAAVGALLEGPGGTETPGGVEANTEIPAGASLERASLSGEGIAEVRLSPAFLEGIPADSASRTQDQKADLNARLAQLTYTATQFSDVKEVRVLSGGTLVEPDLSREDYAKPSGGPPQISKPRGSRLPGTRQVQVKLAKLGYLPKSAIDGREGYWTRQAVIAFQAWNGLGRDGVVGPATSAALRTAHRPAPQAGGPAKRIEVHNEKGVTLLIAGGRVKRAIHTSSGAAGTETPPGHFSITRKELNSWSVPFSSWLPYASYFNQGIAFHEYADVPPYPASHGCVRVPAPEAKRVYAFAALGTPVVVI